MSTFYVIYPVQGSGGGGDTGTPIVEYPNFASFPSPSAAGDGALALALDTSKLYVSNGTSWVLIGGVIVDNKTITINGSGQLQGLSPLEFEYTLQTADITNQYVDFTVANGFPAGAQVAFGVSNAQNSIEFFCGDISQSKGTDYSTSLTGGSGGSTRISFLGDLATGGNAALVAGEVVTIYYSHQ